MEEADKNLRGVLPSWYAGGFPEAEPATVKQRAFLQRRVHMLYELLPINASMAIRMMGSARWLETVPKTDASGIIAKVKHREQQQKEEELAERIAKKKDDVDRHLLGRCSACGGVLEEGTVMRRCAECGKASFYVRM